MLSRTHYTFYIINYFAIIWTIVEALPTLCPAEVSSIRTLKHYLQGVTLISWTRLVRNNTLPWLYSFGENPSDLYNMCESVLLAGLGEVESENFSGWGTIIQWPILSPQKKKKSMRVKHHLSQMSTWMLSNETVSRAKFYTDTLNWDSPHASLAFPLISPPSLLHPSLFISFLFCFYTPFVLSPLSLSVLPLLNSLPC